MLTKSQIAKFEDLGCLVLEDVFTENDMYPVKAEFSAVVEREAQRLFGEGKLDDLYKDEPFERRMAKVAEVERVAREAEAQPDRPRRWRFDAVKTHK